MTIQRYLKYGILGLAMVTASISAANDYPNKPIRYIAPFAPGGATDIVARLISEPMSQRLGQQVVVDNRSGASGLVGTRLGVQSPPDGYTVFAVASNYLTFPSMVADMDFDINTSISPISQIVNYPSLLLVHPDFPAKDLKEFIELVKSDPDKYKYAMSGFGTASHLGGVLLNREAGLSMEAVPYRGGGPANLDVMAGNVTMHFGPVVSAIEFIRSGQLRALAVATEERLPVLPDVPTMKEEGFSDFVLGEFQGVVGPAGMPEEIVDKLYQTINEVMQAPEMREKFETQGGVIAASTPADFAEFIRTQSEKWNAIAVEAGVTPQ